MFFLGTIALAAIIGLLYAFTRAEPLALSRSLRYCGAILLGLAALAMVPVGRIGMAIILGGASWMVWTGRRLWPRSRLGAGAGYSPRRRPTGSTMGRAEALRILGLQDGADKTAIRAAHKRLMMRAHPDRGGSNALAARINEAKDVLLGA
jgi:hypothetical protein